MSSRPNIAGFRGSDWDNAGKNLYAVRYETKKQCDVIHRSKDRGRTFKPWCDLPFVPEADLSQYYWYSIPLMIPSKVNDDEPDQMLISPIGSQTLYRCADISQESPRFDPVLTPGGADPGRAGVFNGFAENKIDGIDFDGTVYVGWYAIYSGSNQALLYKATAADSYTTWQLMNHWHARHIHAVRVNPYNGYLYVVLGEPNLNYAGEAPTAADAALIGGEDAAKIMRSKDGGGSWFTITNTWDIEVKVVEGNWLGLYFSTLGFVPGTNRVVLGEDTDWVQGSIFYFDDDDREGNSDPIGPQLIYTTDNAGEFFNGAVTMGDKLYFASQFLAPTKGVTSTKCVSTTDGISWKVEQVCGSTEYASNPGPNSCLGVFTYHPERGGRLIYSLSTSDSFIIDQ